MPYDNRRDYDDQCAVKTMENSKTLPAKSTASMRSQSTDQRPITHYQMSKDIAMSKALTNRSSVYHNIINGEPNYYS